MVSAKDVAMFFLQKDTEGTLFDDHTLKSANGRCFYEGNARLNKFLHLAQNIYIAKESKPLFEEPLYAYDNGGIVKSIQENYIFLLSKKDSYDVNLPDDIKVFLSKLFMVLANAPVDKLIEFSHQDPAWQDKRSYYRTLESQRMHSMDNIEDYKERYEDILELLERMPT